jgi:hypothetical protein
MRADAEKAKQWEQTVAEQAASGLSAAAFCRDRSVAPALFYQWRRRLRGDTAEASAAAAAGFVEMVAGSGPGSRGSGVALRLGEGLTVALERGFDEGTLRRVMAALRGTAG